MLGGKRMRKIILTLILFVNIISAQTDSQEYLEYYPLHIGDKWVYEIVQLSGGQWDTSYQTISVIGDTMMSDGYTYFIMGPSGSFERLDSAALCVKAYSSLDEIVLFDLSPFEGDIDSTMQPDSSILYRNKITGNAGSIVGQFEKIGYYYDFDGLDGPYKELTNGIGYTKYFWEEALPYQKLLIGAEIDGVVYGNISGIMSDISKPTKFRLYPNYPNPFNASTKIKYEIYKSGRITITVFDITGKFVETIEDTYKQSGNYTTNWNALRYISGIYIIQMQVGDFNQSIKCLLLK